MPNKTEFFDIAGRLIVGVFFALVLAVCLFLLFIVAVSAPKEVVELFVLLVFGYVLLSFFIK